MSGLATRLVAHVHGHLGWLAALALVHPAVLLRRPRRRALGVAAAATGLATAAAACGAVLYPDYRSTVKPLLFGAVPAVGELFERKEHLGVAGLVLAWVGLGLHALARRAGTAQAQLGRCAFVPYTGAAATALAAAGLGLIVAAHRSL